MKPVVRTVMLIPSVALFITMASTASAENDALDRVELWADTAEDIEQAPGNESTEDAESNWLLSIGLAGGASPDYEGSDDYEFGFAPYIGISWRDRIFYRGKSLGANLFKGNNFKAGPILSWTSGRNEDDNDRLEGLGDVDGSVEAGGFVSYRSESLRFKLEARQDIDSGHEGALVELSGSTTLPIKSQRVLLSLGTTWASADYMESFFGINNKQSANSGLRTYDADAGFKDASISLATGYSITERWRIGGKIQYLRLLGDAADSPIVDDENQFIAGISLVYYMGSKALLKTVD